MKKTLAALAATFALSGCLQGPTTADEVRKLTASGKMFSKQYALSVPRSHSAVSASLRKGAQKCMNRTVQSTSTTYGRYGPVTQTIITDYRASVKTTKTGTELALHQQVRGGLFKQPGGLSYVVDAVPTSGGTKIVMHGGRWGYKNLNAAVEQWARGGSIVCPKMPGSG